MGSASSGRSVWLGRSWALRCGDKGHSARDPVSWQFCPWVGRGLGLRKRIGVRTKGSAGRTSATWTKAGDLFSFAVSTTGMVGAGSLCAAATSPSPAFTLPVRPGFLHGGSVSSNTLCRMRLHLSSCQRLQSIWPARCCFKLRMGLSQNLGFKHLQTLGKFASQFYGFALSLLHFSLT